MMMMIFVVKHVNIDEKKGVKTHYLDNF